VVVDHICWFVFFFPSAAGVQCLCGVTPSAKGMVYLSHPFRCQILPQKTTFCAAKGTRWMNGASRCRWGGAMRITL
jgi:hypothetical protein